MRNGCITLAAVLAILAAGSMTTDAQAGSAQSSAPSKYNGQYNGHSNSATPVVWTGQNVGITELSDNQWGALVLTRHFKKYSSKFQGLNELL
jgi:hypothetical protein